MFARLLYRELCEQRPVLLVGPMGLSAVALTAGLESPSGDFTKFIAVGFFVVLWPAIGAVAASIAHAEDAAAEYIATLSTSQATRGLAKTFAGLLSTATLAPGIVLWSALRGAPVGEATRIFSFWKTDMIADSDQRMALHSQSILALMAIALLAHAVTVLLSSSATGGPILILGSLVTTYLVLWSQGWIASGLGWMRLPQGMAVVILVQAALLLLAAMVMGCSRRWRALGRVPATAAALLGCVTVPFALWAHAGMQLDATSRSVSVSDVSADSRLALLEVWDEHGNYEVWVQQLDTGRTIMRTSRGSGLATFLPGGRRFAYRRWARSWGLLSAVAQTRVVDIETTDDRAWLEVPRPRDEMIAGAPFPRFGPVVGPEGVRLAQLHGNELYVASPHHVQRVDIGTSATIKILGWVRDPPGLVIFQGNEVRDAWDELPVPMRWALSEIDPETGDERYRLRLPDTAKSVMLDSVGVTGTNFEEPILDRDHVVVHQIDISEDLPNARTPNVVLTIDMDQKSLKRSNHHPATWYSSDAARAYWIEGSGADLSAVVLEVASGQLSARRLGTSAVDNDYPFSGIAASPDGNRLMITDSQVPALPVTRVLPVGPGMPAELVGWRAIRFLSNHEVIVEDDSAAAGTTLAVWNLDTGTTRVFFWPASRGRQWRRLIGR